MDKDEQYILEKACFLHAEFSKLEKTLNSKYDVKISFDAHYDCVLITGRKNQLEPIWASLLQEIKDFAKNTLNEEYVEIVEEPAEVSSSPQFDKDLIWRITIERQLKDKEPERKPLAV